MLDSYRSLNPDYVNSKQAKSDTYYVIERRGQQAFGQNVGGAYLGLGFLTGAAWGSVYLQKAGLKLTPISAGNAKNWAILVGAGIATQWVSAMFCGPYAFNERAAKTRVARGEPIDEVPRI